MSSTGSGTASVTLTPSTSRTPSATASMTPSTSVLCVAPPQPVTIYVRGINTSVVLDPAVGVLLRLAFACPLGVPLPCVTIDDVYSTSADTADAVNATWQATEVAPSNPVNVAYANCTGIGASSVGGRSLLRTILGRDLGTGASGTGRVAVVLSLGVSSSLSASINTLLLLGGTGSGSGSGSGGSFTPFINAGATASGVTPASVQISAGPGAGGGGGAGAADAPATIAGVSITPIVVGAVLGGAALLALCVLFLLGMLIGLRSRRERPLKVHDEPSGRAADASAFVRANPMSSPRQQQPASGPIQAPPSQPGRAGLLQPGGFTDNPIGRGARTPEATSTRPSASGSKIKHEFAARLAETSADATTSEGDVRLMQSALMWRSPQLHGARLQSPSSTAPEAGTGEAAVQT